MPAVARMPATAVPATRFLRLDMDGEPGECHHQEGNEHDSDDDHRDALGEDEPPTRPRARLHPERRLDRRFGCHGAQYRSEVTFR